MSKKKKKQYAIIQIWAPVYRSWPTDKGTIKIGAERSWMIVEVISGKKKDVRKRISELKHEKGFYMFMRIYNFIQS